MKHLTITIICFICICLASCDNSHSSKSSSGRTVEKTFTHTCSYCGKTITIKSYSDGTIESGMKKIRGHRYCSTCAPSMEILDNALKRNNR